MSDVFHTLNNEPDKALRDSINESLRDIYGVDTVSGLQMFRISWSEDQFEKKLGTYADFTPSGLFIREVTEVRLVPKYRQYCSRKYVIEQLVGIDPQAAMEIKDATMSYEPRQPIQHNVTNKYLPPRLDVCQFYIDIILAATGKRSLAHYTDPEADGNNGLTAKAKRVQDLIDYLYGEDSGLQGAIVHGSGVAGFYPKVD